MSYMLMGGHDETNGMDARKEDSDWAAKVTPPDSTFITVHPPIL